MSDIYTKITNLMELARNNPSEEEAASAAALARKLMLKHNIDERDLGHKSNVAYHGGGTVDRDYYRLLASGVSVLLPVSSIFFEGGKVFKWAGTSLNSQVADQMLEFWAEQVEALYKIHLPRGMSKSARAKYRKDFKRNCAVGIIHRARELREQQNLDKGTGTALMVITSELEQEVDDFLSTQSLRQGRAMKINSNSLGAQHGRQAAGSVRMNQGIS